MAGMCRSKLIFGHPLVTILGCTGTGKSKLAIELAKRFNGEIINSDAMQMYEGLDIITNKVTKEEQEGIRHHLLGFSNPLKKLNVCQYKNSAMNSIREIIERNKLPIIVGGTFYYVESVLYDFVIGSPEFTDDEEENSTESQDVDRSRKSPEGSPPKKRMKIEDYQQLEKELEKLDSETLHEKLKEVDPELADMTHPNSRRKVLRGILAYHQYGETLTSIIKRQRSQPGGCSSGGPLKFTNSLILWLQCDADVLMKRLDDRVDGMVARGLLNEILEFHEKYKEEEVLIDTSSHRGIKASIGFKEFQEFLMLDEEKRESEEGEKLFKNGVELLKIATRQYAKQQVKWIKNRLLKDSQKQTPPIYKLDVSDLSKWDENVYKVAEEILECHLVGKKPSVEPLVIEGTRTPIDRIHYCECGTKLEGKIQYEIHLKSKNHKRKLKKKLEKEKALKETENSSVQATI